MSGKKPVKRRFKPKKPADIKDEPKDEIEEPAQVQQAAAAEITPKKKQKEKTPKPKKERKYTQIRGVLDASGVEQRGTQSRWGSSKTSHRYLAKPPVITDSKKTWSKSDVKEELEETTQVLTELCDNWTVDDNTADLLSAPDLW